MKKISVSESEDDVKRVLLPINEEVCIVYNRTSGDIFIITFDKNVSFIEKNLSITGIREFTEAGKVDFIMSEDDFVILGREDFLK